MVAPNQSVRINVGNQSIEIQRQQQIEQNKNSPETLAAKSISEAQAIKSKAAYKANTGRDFGSDPAKWVDVAAKPASGGGGSNPLAFITTAVSFISNPLGTMASILTGKKDIM